MPAWEVERTWTRDKIEEYRSFVPRRFAQYLTNANRFTCEDLALSLIIDFAAEQKLPVLIANQAHPAGLGPGSYDTVEELKRRALRTSAASDILNPLNTVEVGSHTDGDAAAMRLALAGDLIFLDYSARWNHIQVVTESRADGLSIGQGNLESPCNGFELLFADGNDPADSCYAGYPLAQYDYDRAGLYSRTGEPVYHQQRGRVRRWNFHSWNERYEQSGPQNRMQMAPRPR